MSVTLIVESRHVAGMAEFLRNAGGDSAELGRALVTEFQSQVRAAVAFMDAGELLIKAGDGQATFALDQLPATADQRSFTTLLTAALDDFDHGVSEAARVTALKGTGRALVGDMIKVQAAEATRGAWFLSDDACFETIGNAAFERARHRSYLHSTYDPHYPVEFVHFNMTVRSALKAAAERMEEGSDFVDFAGRSAAVVDHMDLMGERYQAAVTDFLSSEIKVDWVSARAEDYASGSLLLREPLTQAQQIAADATFEQLTARFIEDVSGLADAWRDQCGADPERALDMETAISNSLTCVAWRMEIEVPELAATVTRNVSMMLG